MKLIITKHNVYGAISSLLFLSLILLAGASNAVPASLMMIIGILLITGSFMFAKLAGAFASITGGKNEY